MINEENGVNYNDGIKKCHELLRELQEKINLNDNMDIEKTLLKMRSAGKSRRPRSIKESDRENVFLEFEQKILK